MERRRSERQPIVREVFGRVPATLVSATVLDVSATGCMGEADSVLIQRGATILLTFSDADEVAGRVVWREGLQFGVQFHEPISDRVLARLRQGEAVRPQKLIELRDHFGRPLPPLGAQIRIRPAEV